MIGLYGVRKCYKEKNNQVHVIFDELSFEIPKSVGSIAILGRSGSGKTTLLNILAGMDTDYSGRYRFGNTVLGKSERELARFRRENIGVVTQNHTLLSDRTVLQNVALGAARGRAGLEYAKQCLQLVRLEGYEYKRPKELSGGESQRVAIARALAGHPKVVLADEPSGALDEKTEGEILDLFECLQSQNVQFVIATHSQAIAHRCQRQYVIESGRLVRQNKGRI